ncbi:aldo/keto reductase [bacterium D16-76]|nr:aldo/keto reductase [bacterium D16-76]
MKYTRLGNTGTEVSRICLGCMSFGDSSQGITGKGWAIDEQSSREIIKRALELGINCLKEKGLWDESVTD